MTTRKYTLTRADAERIITALANNPPSASETPWRITTLSNRIIASPPPSYRLTFGVGGATAIKSSRSDRWRIIYGVG